MKVWLDGELVDREQASVSVFDHGVLYGDGVFEGIRVYSGKIFECDAHVDRLFDSARALRLKVPYEKQAIADAGSRAVHVSVDGYGDLGSADEDERKEAVAKHMPWFDICKAVGMPSFRANTGGKAGVSEDTIAACIRSFKELAAEGERKGVSVLIENHGGISGDPELIVRIMEEVGSPNIGTCPDFGNTPDETRYEFLERIMPYAKILHAKFLEFDEDGEETKIDAKRCLDLARAVGFDGYCSIEFEGSEDQPEGVTKSAALLRKYL